MTRESGDKLQRSLRWRSPIRAWLERRRRNAVMASSEDLLRVLADPSTSNWRDQAVGYQTLGELELSPPERRQAARLLVRPLTPRASSEILFSRLGRATVLAWMVSSSAIGVFSLFWAYFVEPHASAVQRVYFFFVLSTLLTPFVTPFCVLHLAALDRKRTAVVQRAALEALHRIAMPEYILPLYSHLYANEEVRSEIQQLLLETLPTLDETWHGRLPTDAFRALVEMAVMSVGDLGSEALEALHRIGDSIRPEAAERLLKFPASAHVRERAATVVPALLAQPAEEPTAAVPPPSLADSSRQWTSPSPTSPRVVALERKLRPTSPIRTWLQRRREKAQAASADALLNAMENPNATGWADRIAAFEALCEIELTQEERSHAGRMLGQALAPIPWGDALFSPLGSSVLYSTGIAFVLTMIGQFALSPGYGLEIYLYLLGVPLGIAAITPLVFAGLSLRNLRRTRAVQRTALTALIRIGDPQSLLVLTQCLHSRPALRPKAVQALKAILPGIDASWYGHLPVGSTTALVDLARSPEEELALAALAALEQAGDGTAVEGIERIGRDTSRSEAVRALAAAILPALITRRERERSASTLLRASEQVATEHLVRPVYGTEPDAANLLRASQPNGPNRSGQ